LRDENARAGSPGSALFQIGRPVAVKSGFIPGSPSYWVAGYTPQLVVVVWASTGEKDAEGGDINIAGIAAGLWRALIQYSSQSLKLEDWQLPAGIVILDVCYPSGLLPSENCPRVVREPFIEGNEPFEEDVLFQMLEVNRETGLLASVFTPPQQIEERVYLSVPEIAYDWAQNAGIPAPPDQYDLEDLDSGEDGFSITSPEIFSFVRGETQVIGSLPEEGFDSARLQYGMGMNPGSWLQIGTEITAPGKNISLGTWDTKNLEDGIYALQLVKIGERQEVDKTSLVVSVDNTPPEILLVTDYSDQEITYQAGKEVVFQADFANQSEIQKVRFYIDSGLKSTRTSFPFVYTWPLTLGEHRLRITAEDQAGNQGEQSITFQVVSP
jgi:membrane carboxypeptidase/penicillin-binding protein PbpC